MNYTFVGAYDPSDHTEIIRLRNGALVLAKGQYADLTDPEYASLRNRFVLVPGTQGQPATTASPVTIQGATAFVQPTKPVPGAGQQAIWFDSATQTTGISLVDDQGNVKPLGSASSGGGGGLSTVSATSASSTTLAESVYEAVDATAGTRTRALPTGVAASKQVAVEKTDASLNVVNVTGKIRGSSSATVSLVAQYESIVLVSEGNDSWRPVAGHKTFTSLDARYAPRAVAGGNLGATATLDITTRDFEVWLSGTLTADAALTINGLRAGVRVLLLLNQDATGGRTLTVNGGAVNLGPGASAAGASFQLPCAYDGTDLYVASA